MLGKVFTPLAAPHRNAGVPGRLGKGAVLGGEVTTP